MTIASGILTYTVPLTPADALPGGSLYPTSLGSRSLWSTKNNPYTGKKIEGWRFDSRVWPDDNIENINTFVPSIYDPTISGITESYFQSGIGDNEDLRLESLRYQLASGLQTTGAGNLWTPQVNHGYYYDYDEEGYLFSDDSLLVYPSYSGVISGLNRSVADGLNYVRLPEFPKVGTPILARTFAWDEDAAKYSIHKEYRKKTAFTGTRQADYSRLDTYDENRHAILFDNIDTTELECVVTYSGFIASGITPAVVFNQQVCEPIGTITSSGLPTFTTLDVLGYADGESQQLHFTYAPVDLTSPVRVFSWSQSTVSGITDYTEWVPVPSGTNFTGNQVLLDADLGTIQFGTVESGQNLPNVGDYIGAHYYPTVQIEYEPELTDDLIAAPEANLNPIYRRTGRGFVYLSTRVSDPVSIVLTAELPLLSTDKYGPLAIGSNYCALVATVTDRKGNVLEGIPVDIFITSEPHAGTFGASDVTVTAITDEYGEARAFYNPPRTINEIGEEIDASHFSVDAAPAYPDFPAVTHATTLTTSNLLVEASDPPDDVYVYGVYTDDPLLGILYSEEAVTHVNLFTYPEEFDHSDWGLLYATVTPNATTSHTSASTAEYLEEVDTGSALPHYVSQKVTHVVSDNCVSAYLKKSGTRTWGTLFVNNGYTAGWFDLDAGTVGSVVNGTSGMTYVGSGWYRCWVVGDASPSDNEWAGIAVATADLEWGYDPVTVGGIYIWGAQFETGVTTPSLYDDGTDTSIASTSAAEQLAEYYRQYLTAEGIWGPTGMASGGIVSTAAIEWEDGHRLIWNLARPVAFEANEGLGRRMILTEYDSTALNPHNPSLTGAWVPKQPFKVENVSTGIYNIIFDTSDVLIPAPSGSLNSYFVVAPTSLRIQASMFNARLNKTIYSNEIQIKLEVPDYMNGLWIVEGVNSMNIAEISSLITTAMEGKKLPLGFRLRSSSITLAAALNGITFLDVNSTDDPVLAPSTWPSLGFEFNVDSIT